MQLDIPAGARPAPPDPLPLCFNIELSPIAPRGFALMLGATFGDEDDCSFINEDIANTRVATIDDALAVIRRQIDRDGTPRRRA